VKLEVFDVTGRLVNVLVDEHRPAGPGSVAWDGIDSDGDAVPSGIYFSRLSAGGRRQSMKMLRLK
jgi:flagellar hook assembly protein FlgD